MWKRLMVPLDGSSLAERALDAASAMASATGAELHLVHVRTLAYVSGYSSRGEWEGLSHGEDQEYLDGVHQRLGAAAPPVVRTALLVGSVVPALCDYALAERVDLVVMTTHGNTGLVRALRGSVADGVVRHAPVPVLMLPARQSEPPESPATPAALALSSLLVALDGSAFAEEVLPHAADLARWSGATLYLVRVVAPVTQEIEREGPRSAPPGRTVLVSGTGLVVAEAARYLANVAQRLRERYPLLTVETQIRVGDDAAAEFVDTLQQHAPAVAALTSHGRGASRLLIGSVADAVLREANMPVLILHPRPGPAGARRFSSQAAPEAEPATR